jgi:hypothetical protein
VVDIGSGESWRKLSGHPATAPEPGFIPIVEGERFAIREKGKPPAAFNASSDGIALSDDGATLYHCPLSSRDLFSVPTALLRDRSVSDDAVARAAVPLARCLPNYARQFQAILTGFDWRGPREK